LTAVLLVITTPHHVPVRAERRTVEPAEV
jgi:hypothetical protein